MEIVVQVKEDVARALAGLGPSTPEFEAIMRATTALGVALTAVHSGTSDPALVKHFHATVSGPRALEVIEALRKYSSVEAAYVKPQAEPS